MRDGHCLTASWSLLFRTAIVQLLLAALLAMPALTSSSAGKQRTAAARCSRGCRVAVAADASFPSQYLTTALVQLYSLALRAVRAKTRGDVLCWHFSLDLP